METNEIPVASMYVSEDCALIGFSFVNKGICLDEDFFKNKNKRSALDQTTQDLERILANACRLFFKAKYGSIPKGKFTFTERYDAKSDLMLYEAYFKAISASFK